MENQKNDEFTVELKDLIHYYWQKKFLIIIISFSFAILGIIYALLAREWYSASARILPNSGNTLSGMLGQYQGIASMLGINLGAVGENDQLLYPEIVKSNFVIEHLMKKKFYSTILNDSTTLYDIVNIEVDTTEENWQYVKYEKTKEEIRENYIFSELDDETGILTIGIEVPEDPVLASEAANYLVDLLDLFNRTLRSNKAREERKFIEKSIDSLAKKIKLIEEELIDFETKHINDNAPELKLIHERIKRELDLHNLLYTEIKKQLELTKIEEIRQNKTFDVLDYPTVPILKSRPQRTIIVLFSGFIGFFIAILVVLFKFMYIKLIKTIE